MKQFKKGDIVVDEDYCLIDIEREGLYKAYMMAGALLNGMMKEDIFLLLIMNG